jgi:hypothetical protein
MYRWDIDKGDNRPRQRVYIRECIRPRCGAKRGLSVIQYFKMKRHEANTDK